MVRRLLVWTSIAGLWAAVGCAELDAAAPAGSSAPAWQGEQPMSWIDVADEQDPAPAMPELMDLELCEALAADQRDCASADDVELDVTACAARFACSRRLWRAEAADVYGCLRGRPCDDADPVMTCLREVADQSDPSAAELDFEQRLEAVHEQCGELVEIAPRQADAVYEALGACLTANDGCDAKAACVEDALRALVDATCGAADGATAA